MDQYSFSYFDSYGSASFKTLVKIYDDEAGDVNIQVTGYQWKWQYRYLEDDISFLTSTDLDEIYNLVPKGENYFKKLTRWSLYL